MSSCCVVWFRDLRYKGNKPCLFQKDGTQVHSSAQTVDGKRTKAGEHRNTPMAAL